MRRRWMAWLMPAALAALLAGCGQEFQEDDEYPTELEAAEATGEPDAEDPLPPAEPETGEVTEDEPGTPTPEGEGGEVETTASGLKYEVLEAGTGPSPQMGDQVVVHYTGQLEDGTVFDSSRDRGEPATFAVGQLIEGWNEALTMMKEGGHWKLTIPSDLAYGANPPPGSNIPPNATLIFDLELIDVVE